MNLCFLRTTRVHIPNGKSIGSAVFAQLTAESLYTLQWAPLSPKIGWIWTPSNTWFFGPIPAHNSNSTSIGSAVFAQMTAECPYTKKRPFLLSKLPPPMGASGPPSNTCFPGPIRVLNPNGISIGSAFLQGSLVWQTDRPRYSVGNNRPHPRR